MFGRVLLAAAFAVAAGAAQAFCGFYVARADGDLYNRASKVVYTRTGDTSVITMSSDYRGPAAEFAMVVPTPRVLNRNQVQTVPSATVDHLDRYTAPRLVEYFDYDPCEGGLVEPVFEATVVEEGGRTARQERRDGARALGVTILRDYAVGSYDIQILSAKQSDGLATFLRGEGYKLPDGAEAALADYIQMGMKFFVARVNLQRHTADKAQDLEPLQLTFRSPDFMLPIQLGKLNADGPQDLLVMTLTRKGRVKLQNYTMKELPTDIAVPVFVKDVFPNFDRAMFDKLAPNSGAFLEYAWDMAWCDPCADDPLSFDEFRQLGVSWLRRGNVATPDVFVTRMHIRYSDKGMFEDLKFVETDNRENFQGRYILNQPFDGKITCEEGQQYVTETRARIKAEAAALRKLTGWSAADIGRRIARSVDARYR
ncbi:MAG: DUF2330 domain-containing protein [Gemmobacter sp.]